MATTGHHSESSPLLYRNATCRNNRNWWAIALVGSLAAIAVVGMACILLLVGIDSTHTIPKRERHDLEHPSVGRFVHITDLHVDPLYVSGATAYSQCHRQQKGTDELTGTFGRAQAKCDSPVALINATSEYLRRRWRDNVDFVIWTGDSGRHDNDAEEPRTFREIAAQNAIAAQSLRHAFPSTPLVPNVGNNDVSPHNELPGPGHKRARRTFAALAEAWSELVPEDQQATFRHGGYFARDVTSRLTALSLNTMY
ncbi:Endopolyphosphatase, partial [Coemansia sp. RSA 2320]